MINDTNSVPNESHDTNIDIIKTIISIATEIIATAGNHFFIFINHLLIIKTKAAATSEMIDNKKTHTTPWNKATIHPMKDIIAKIAKIHHHINSLLIHLSHIHLGH